MKKTLLILCALLLTAVGASAQVTDVTATYIKNPSFESVDVTDLTMDGERCDETVGGAWKVSELTNWTLTNVSNFDICDIMTKDATATDNNLGVPGEAADGDYMLYLKKTWASSLTAAVAQTIILPAGTYKLTVDSKCFSGGSSANLVAGSSSNAITINGTSGGNASNNSYPMTELTEWTTNELTFIVTPEEDQETAEVEIGVEFTLTNTSPGSFVLDNFKLYSYDYNVTKVLANPSFEDDDPVEGGWTLDYNDSEGSTPRAAEGKGAWVIPETGLTGWNLNGTVSVKDIMSADAAATDNAFGAPGKPADGTYMLYLRDAWNTEESSVMQSLVLPAGDYVVTVDTKCASTAGSTATLVVGEASVALTINSTMPEDWDTAVLNFSLEETTEVSLGVDIQFASTSDSSNGSFLLDNFQLWSTEDVEAINFGYDVTWKLDNPSFEVDNVVANLEVDTSADSGTARHNDDNEGAWIVESLTGWELSSSEVDAVDLMTAKANATDNGLGVPSAAADGTYWLYLKKSWGDNAGSASVKQKVTLPAGDYKLTVQSMAVAGSATANLFVDSKTQAITINASAASNDILKTMEWTTNDLVFTISDEEAEVELGVDFTFPTGASVGSILLDNFKLYSVEAIEEGITWTMTDAGWGTMILPFATSIPDGLTLYADDAITVSDSELTVDEEKAVASIAANTPYLVKSNVEVEEIPTEGIPYTFTGTPTNTADTYTVGVLTGTLVDLAVAKGAAFATDGTQYLLQNHEDEGVAFYPITSDSAPTEEAAGASLDAYHCYLTVSAEESEEGELAKLSIVLPGAGEETGIVAVEGAEAEANGAIYDLSGRRVAKAVKGVYIQNGKKVLVR